MLMRPAAGYPGMNIRTAAAPMTAVAIQPRMMIDRLAVKAPITDFLETSSAARQSR